MRKLQYILTGALLLGCAPFLISCQQQPAQEKTTIVKSMYDGDTQMWNHIFNAEPPVKFTDVPLGVILPHHMIDGLDLAKFYKGLAKVINPSIVVVISPNHYQNGSANIQTCRNCDYETINGSLQMETDFIRKLTKDGIASANDETFIKEHGLYNHAPYIKKYFPQAKFVPIALKWETTPEETVKLSQWLSANLPENSLVIASVDFSHYIPVEAASFHDIASYATIKNFDYANIYDLEIDSPPSISTITHLMEARGAMKVERLNHTNNQDHHAARVDSTTSHQYITFSKGEKQPEKTLTIMSFGNNDRRNPGLYDDYRWDINAPDPNTETDPFLKDIRGVEDRFLVGSDFLVFNLPQDSCELERQNGLQISFCDFTEKNTVEEQLKTVKEQTSKGADYVYLLYHFKNSKLSAEEKAIAGKFADNGVTVFIGRGIKDVLPVEHYGNSIIAPSLGDFITDPSVPDSKGEILETALTPNGIRTFTFPIEITKGYPRLIPQPLDPDFQK